MFSSLTDPALIRCLQKGGVVVIPTDTLYGVVARAADEEAVKRVYRVRGRAPSKPCIILVADRSDITDNQLWTPAHRKIADTHWPGALSLVAPTKHTRKYLHRGTQTLAYRVPAREDLRRLLALTGPLVAPSANPEGNPPATTLQEAQAYFGTYVDGYVDGGVMTGHAPSTLVTIVSGKPKILRQGAVKLR
jgi:L-threonylcarbamoyladenylate synthase